MTESLRFVGMDVHKDSITTAVAEQGRKAAYVYAETPNDWGLLLKKLTRLGPKSQLRCCYEAGPCGYGLYRKMKDAEIACVVIAPSLVPTQGGRRVKTDRRDAKGLAHFLRSGDLVEVFVPDEETEAIRDLERAREDAKHAERAARHQLSKSPGQLMAFLGLVPSEYSSGQTRHQGRITRAGNKHVRRLLVESAWSYHFQPKMSKAIRQRNQGVAPGVQRLAWKAQKRLHKRLYHLIHKGKTPQKAITAVARELAGFLWAVGQEPVWLAEA